MIKYLNKFYIDVLYISFSRIMYLIFTSKDALSINYSSILNHILGVEPKQILDTFVKQQRSSFLKR